MRSDIIAAAATRNITPKPAQIKVAAALLSRRDTLLIANTGFGKTLAPQLATVLRHRRGLGLTVYIGPLIALAADMERRCIDFGIRVAKWNSTVSEATKLEIIQQVRNNQIDLLILTAESLGAQSTFGEMLRTALSGRVGLCWLDEADTAVNDKYFRVSWAKIGAIVAAINPAVILACTATCPPDQEKELIGRCALRNPYIERLSSDRSNFKYAHSSRSEHALAGILQNHRGEKILVYAATVAQAQKLAELFKGCGYKTACYCGPMKDAEKRAVQQGFLTGENKIVIATCAFGRGVDVRDIRALIVYDPPKNISEFAQQIGRAGRDGLPSTIYVCSLGAEEGWQSQRFLVESQFPSLPDIMRVWQHLKIFPQSGAEAKASVAKAAGVATWKYTASAIYRLLQKHGLLAGTHTAYGEVWTPQGNFNETDWSEYLAQKPKAIHELDAIRALWQLPAEKLRAALVEYLDASQSAGTATRNAKRPTMFD